MPTTFHPLSGSPGPVDVETSDWATSEPARPTDASTRVMGHSAQQTAAPTLTAFITVQFRPAGEIQDAELPQPRTIAEMAAAHDARLDRVDSCRYEVLPTE